MFIRENKLWCFSVLMEEALVTDRALYMPDTGQGPGGVSCTDTEHLEGQSGGQSDRHIHLQLCEGPVIIIIIEMV